jgi:hypothetical protein
MLGYAVTCKGDSTTEDKDRREHTELYRAIAALQPLPAVVVIGDDGDPNKIHQRGGQGTACFSWQRNARDSKAVGTCAAIGGELLLTRNSPHLLAAVPWSGT